MTNASEDLFIKDLESEFGDSGYAFWFKTLELIGSQGSAGTLDISETVWRQVIHSNRTDHLRRLYAFVTERGKMSVEHLSNGLLRIKCPKFAEFSDNFTKYGKPLQSNFKVALKQEEEEDKELEHNNKVIPSGGSLEIFLRQAWGRKGLLSAFNMTKMIDLGKLYGYDLLYDAIGKAAEQGKESVAYVKGILEKRGTPPKRKQEIVFLNDPKVVNAK